MRILCISGSRADYGGIEAVYETLKKREGVDARFSDQSVVLGHADLVVLLGDRSEILKAAINHYLEKMPIAHLSGGDVTEGSQDDCMRHAITKLSHLHFPTSNWAAKVILQLGEEPWRIHTVGYPGTENMVTHDKAVASILVGNSDFILVVWHPNTLISNSDALKEAKVLTQALEKVNYKKLVLGPNFDAGGYEIANFFESWAAQTGDKYIGKLPRDMYLTCLKHAVCLVGNSSSGFYEAPSFGTPVVNIGKRQLGRIVPPNMVNCDVDADEIAGSINMAITTEKIIGRIKDNAYHKDGAADKIADIIIEKMKDPQKLLHKKFCYTGHLSL